MQGKVLWFDIRDGYGVIVDQDRNEYYTDVSVCPVDLKSGEPVTFEINPAINSPVCAYKVFRK